MPIYMWLISLPSMPSISLHLINNNALPGSLLSLYKDVSFDRCNLNNIRFCIGLDTLHKTTNRFGLSQW